MTVYANIPSSGNCAPGDLRNTYLINASSGAMTRTLADATVSRGQIVTISKVDSSANAVTINTTASQQIMTVGGVVTSLSIAAQGGSYTLACDGTGWHVVAKI